MLKIFNWNRIVNRMLVGMPVSKYLWITKASFKMFVTRLICFHLFSLDTKTVIVRNNASNNGQSSPMKECFRIFLWRDNGLGKHLKILRHSWWTVIILNLTNCSLSFTFVYLYYIHWVSMFTFLMKKELCFAMCQQFPFNNILLWYV